MKKIYIHIGLPKVGSTSLQMWLCKNRKNLSAKGFYYEEDFVRYFIHYVNNPNFDLVKYKEKFQKRLDRIHNENIILSTELITSNNYSLDNNISIMKSFFQSYDVYIILFLKRQDLFLESLYKYQVACGNYSDRFVTFLKDTDLDQLNWYHLIKKLESKFGRNKLLLGPVNKNDNTINMFSEFLGIKNLDTNIRINKSINIDAFEECRVLTKLYENKLDLNLLLNKNKVKEINKSGKSYGFMSLDDRKKLIERYFKKSNNNIENEYGFQESRLFDSLSDSLLTLDQKNISNQLLEKKKKIYLSKMTVIKYLIKNFLKIVNKKKNHIISLLRIRVKYKVFYLPFLKKR